MELVYKCGLRPIERTVRATPWENFVLFAAFVVLNSFLLVALSRAPDRSPYFGNCRYIDSAEYAYSQQKPPLLSIFLAD